MITGNRSYEINEVARLTGLATARLRAWERRYQVVRPRRQANRYRAYSGEQVALLRAFARLVAAGERIGALVRQPRDQVIARSEGKAVDNSPLAQLVQAVKRHDGERLLVLLAEHHRALDIEQFASEIVLPLAEAVGDCWALGQISVAAEHLASEVVVQLLKTELAATGQPGPLLLAACLPGERHEWGFLCALRSLRRKGWRVKYLGADLPLQDLTEAAWMDLPAAVALSSADPDNLKDRLPELRRLPRLLPAGTVVVLGGRGAEDNRSRLRRAGLRVAPSGMPDPPAGVPARRLATR
jgi:MerR family transcriptional regulator, light-induced transcriptional regulator